MVSELAKEWLKQMASINLRTREIQCKIVYYGPGLSGKTTNLQVIHRMLPKDKRSDMASINTEQDRTLFFDFLPLDLGSIKGFRTRFQLYTVPGQVYYNSTRKLVLRGVDGVVFVADSQANRMAENMESLQNLKQNLSEYGLKLEELPFVMQYNKRDMTDILSIDELEERLNYLGAPYFEARAHSGFGVVETLKESAKLVIDKFNKQGAKAPAAPAPARPAVASAAPAPETAAAVVPVAQESPEPVPVPEVPKAEEPVVPAFQAPQDVSFAPPAASTIEFAPPPPPKSESQGALPTWDDDVDDDGVDLIPYIPKK